MVYHPSPHDLWRWTHEGLQRLFHTNGEWATVSVQPSAGTTATLALLISIYIDLATRRAHVGAIGLLIGGLNRAAAAIDRRAAVAVDPGAGAANCHVTAVAP